MLLFYCQNPVFSTYVPFLSCWVQSSTMCYQCISPVCLYCRFQDVAQCPSPKLPAPGTVHCGYCVTVRCPVQQLIRSSVKEFKAWRHKQWGTEKCGFQTTLFTVMRKKKMLFFFFSFEVYITIEMATNISQATQSESHSRGQYSWCQIQISAFSHAHPPKKSASGKKNSYSV